MERFLVVDDDESITRQLVKVIESMGFEAVAHNDPLLAAKEEQFDLILTDFMMPQLNGAELLGRLRDRNPHAVRMLLTAASDFRVAVEAVNRGEVFRLLSKPWQLADLRNSIRQAVDYHRLSAENRRLHGELTARNASLLTLNETLNQKVVERTNGLLEGMVRALDYRDTETQWHSRRVSLYTRKIAEVLGVTGDELVIIEQGALLHDVGKIGVRDSILLKPGPLTPEEWVEMKKHPEMGWRMLESIPYLRDAAEIVFQHQERWDGKGYPRALPGPQMVLGARCFCVADALDAITSDRPYRRGSPTEVAIAEITRLAGTQFDPEAVRAFNSLPRSTWSDIRRDVESMAAEDVRRMNTELVMPPAGGTKQS